MRIFDWFKSHAVLVRATRHADEEYKHTLRSMRDLQQIADEWRIKYDAQHNAGLLREALKLAEEENARLYLIIAELRKQRTDVQTT